MIEPRPRTRAERRVLISVPRPSRDLDGLALVAYHLSRRHGVSASFCLPDDVDDACVRQAPDAIVLDILGWDSRMRQVARAKTLGMRVVIVPVAGLYPSDADHIAGIDAEAREQVDRFLVWGSRSAEHLASHRISASRIRTVGVPRFDFYHPRYHRLMGTREEFLRRQGFDGARAPILVWATGTPEADGLTDHQIAERAELGSLTVEQIRREIGDQRTVFREHSALVMELARRHRDWLVIIKVHPRESPLKYESLVRGQPNVRLATNEPARMFLYHCEALLQCGSTTSTEAWLLDKPVIQLPSTASWNDELPPLYHRANQDVADLEACERVLCDIVGGASQTTERRDARETFVRNNFFASDGMAAERCADEIAALILPPMRTDAESGESAALAHQTAQHGVRSESATLTSRLKDAIGMSRETSLRPWRWARQSAAVTRPTREAVDELYRGFDAVLGADREERSEAAC